MKTVNVLQLAIVDGKLVISQDVTVNGPMLAALRKLGAVAPRFQRRMAGISFFHDANGWTWLVNVN
jgi:hypothetical protein